ncbi:hypothetical protein EVAR_44216_1 [Eumeta japonica]|uniref:Uncharacterized protein n=1 Tax=Eumeta variegata TaxID=151549 RepID=A0A4C1W078_EUMVA|nr:hypothetical protein EVAR_44216_1 [Eumeta japonica]
MSPHRRHLVSSGRVRGKFLVGFSPTLPSCTGARVCVMHFSPPPRRKREKTARLHSCCFLLAHIPNSSCRFLTISSECYLSDSLKHGILDRLRWNCLAVGYMFHGCLLSGRYVPDSVACLQSSPVHRTSAVEQLRALKRAAADTFGCPHLCKTALSRNTTFNTARKIIASVQVRNRPQLCDADNCGSRFVFGNIELKGAAS